MKTKKTERAPVQWTRSETLALALNACTFCYGLGMRPGAHGKQTPCHCVFRAIFRACHRRFRDLCAKEGNIVNVSVARLEGNYGARGRGTWGFKDEEYCADFCLVSRRALTLHQHRVFRFHFLLGADWSVCCAKLGLQRGEFFHEVYRIEEALGRVFRELQPHSLFPLDEYFASTTGAAACSSAEPGDVAPQVPKVRYSVA
jgi:hypothetical protein